MDVNRVGVARERRARARQCGARVVVAATACLALLCGGCAFGIGDGTSGAALQAQAKPGAAAANRVRLCSWNLRKLGDTFDGVDKDYASAAHILDAHCDIAAVIEVMQKGGYGHHPGYDALLSALGSGWDGIVTDAPRPNTSAPQSEYYAFVWRKGRVALCAGWKHLRRIPDNDGSGASTAPDRFLREPAFGCFQAQDGNNALDFMLGDYHARFGKIGDRRTEVGALDDDLNGDGVAGDLFGTMRAARPGENDLFLAGDFNLGPKDLAAALPNYVDATTGTGSTLNSKNGISSNLYDHILIPDRTHTPELSGSAHVIDVRSEIPAGESFYERVSDHLPIEVDLNLIQPDDDQPLIDTGGGPDGGTGPAPDGGTGPAPDGGTGPAPDGGGPGNYYAGIDPGATGATLADELHTLISNDSPVPASHLVAAFANTDTHTPGCAGLFDAYSGHCWDPSQACGQADAEGDCYSRVKVWPTSWWGGGGPAETDLFNVYPIDGYDAARRSNYPLGPVDNPTYTTAGGGRIGPCAATGATGTCFEPPDDEKGDLARSYFYMAIRYQGEFDCCTEVGVDRWNIAPWMETVLRDWSAADPVSDAERARNDAVYALQGNRNPFIDHPAWVDAITDF